MKWVRGLGQVGQIKSGKRSRNGRSMKSLVAKIWTERTRGIDRKLRPSQPIHATTITYFLIESPTLSILEMIEQIKEELDESFT